ncbi:DUF2189 domain-containing protein [Flavobacterium reichenbachii]|uniref:Beta-carotene 15,15'-monooxygenase n=1 Tax=Flavobacterium reichenbachii TaxID=362418 RepID=A0A085ZLY0_9FLAO|nr:hypothetical protein [Flavobacterium reichenbachii]KFF05444.1 hypothetical protein IW19_07910 [Flavobacterium reichenbachii]OXB17784.1 hypothetical protein B0A68_02250 [Flavobacterium reichenbachii]
MKSTHDQIEDIKRDGYTIDFATVFNHAFENYKKIALYSGLIILVFSVVFFIAFMGVLVAFYGAQSISEEFIKDFGNPKQTYIQQLFSMVGIAAISALFAPFGAGFLKMADCADKDEEFNVSTIFSYYKTHHFIQIFTSAFIVAVVGGAIGSVVESYFLTEPLLLFVISFTINIFISFFTYLSVPLIIFGNLKALDSLKTCFIIIGKNPLLIFGLFIVGFLCSGLGLFGCCIGIIFTIAFHTSMTYATYFSLFGAEPEEDSIDSIGKSDLE